MANQRQNKVNSAVVTEMASILREVKDPRVADAFVTITAARVSPDLAPRRDLSVRGWRNVSTCASRRS